MCEDGEEFVVASHNTNECECETHSLIEILQKDIDQEKNEVIYP